MVARKILNPWCERCGRRRRLPSGNMKNRWPPSQTMRGRWSSGSACVCVRSIQRRYTRASFPGRYPAACTPWCSAPGVGGTVQRGGGRPCLAEVGVDVSKNLDGRGTRALPALAGRRHPACGQSALLLPGSVKLITRLVGDILEQVLPPQGSAESKAKERTLILVYNRPTDTGYVPVNLTTLTAGQVLQWC